METPYEGESLAIRLATLTSSLDTKTKVAGYKKLIDLCKQIGWTM